MGIYIGNTRYKLYIGNTRRKVAKPVTYDDRYPIINVIDGVNYYRYTPEEVFVVYTGVGGGGDQVRYYYFGNTTQYSYNRLWGDSKTITGPNSEPPRYFDLSYYSANGYIYNQTREEWLYRGADVPEDMFD